MTKKFYQYEKVEVSPETFIKQRQEWIKYDLEDLEKEKIRHQKKVDKINSTIEKRKKEIREAQQADMEAAKSRSSKV